MTDAIASLEAALARGNFALHLASHSRPRRLLNGWRPTSPDESGSARSVSEAQQAGWKWGARKASTAETPSKWSKF